MLVLPSFAFTDNAIEAIDEFAFLEGKNKSNFFGINESHYLKVKYVTFNM